MKKRKINCLFYYPHEDDHIMNKLVAKWNGPYCHTELAFEDGMATSIVTGQEVFLAKKRYSNPNYKILTCSVSDEQYQKIREFCENKTKNKTKFSMVSMLLSSLPFQIVTRNEKYTFCSRYITEALQAGNVENTKNLNPMLTTPSSLFAALDSDTTRIFDTVPSRLELKWTT